MTRGVRVRASSVVIVQEESLGMGGLGAIIGPMPGFMYAYRCAPLLYLSTSGVAGPGYNLPGRESLLRAAATLSGPRVCSLYWSKLPEPCKVPHVWIGNRQWPVMAARIVRLAPTPLCPQPWLRTVSYISH